MIKNSSLVFPDPFIYMFFARAAESECNACRAHVRLECLDHMHGILVLRKVLIVKKIKFALVISGGPFDLVPRPLFHEALVACLHFLEVCHIQSLVSE